MSDVVKDQSMELKKSILADYFEELTHAKENLRKVVYLLISTGASEIVVFFLALAGGLPLPLFAVQLLWLNLVTNGIQHVALAFEKGEPDVLERAPRPPHQPIFDRRMVEQTVLSGAFIGIAAFFFFTTLAAPAFFCPASFFVPASSEEGAVFLRLFR